MIKSTPTTRGAWLVLALFLVLPACGWRTAKVGPHPAVITVHFQAGVAPQDLDAALARPLEMSVFNSWPTGYNGPYWTLQAWIVDPKQGRLALPRADKHGGLLAGLSVDASRRFLAPPGELKLHLRLACTVERFWRERVERWVVVPTRHGDRAILVPDSVPHSSRVTLASWVRELRLDLAPDQAIELRPFEPPAAGQPGDWRPAP